MLNFSCFLLSGARHGIAAWHIIEQVSDEMKYVWPTQWPEWRWHFQTHGSMNVYTVWKKIDQWVRFRERSGGKKCFSLSQKSICPERKEGGQSSGRRRQLETSEKTMCVVLCVDRLNFITAWPTEMLLYHGLNEHSFLIGWTVSINFWYMDTYETPQVVPVKQTVHCSKLMRFSRKLCDFRNRLNEKNLNIFLPTLCGPAVQYPPNTTGWRT